MTPATDLNFFHRPTGPNGSRSVAPTPVKLDPVIIPTTGRIATPYRMGECKILVDQLPNPWDLDGWHLSISHDKRYPTWDEIRNARYELIPADVTMAMILPPPEQYINHMPNCFQIHQIPGEGVHA